MNHSFFAAIIIIGIYCCTPIFSGTNEEWLELRNGKRVPFDYKPAIDIFWKDIVSQKPSACETLYCFSPYVTLPEHLSNYLKTILEGCKITFKDQKEETVILKHWKNIICAMPSISKLNSESIIVYPLKKK